MLCDVTEQWNEELDCLSPKRKFSKWHIYIFIEDRVMKFRTREQRREVCTNERIST